MSQDSNASTPKSEQDFYRFTFNADQTGVTAVSKLDDGKVKKEATRGYTFDVQQDANGDVVAVERTAMKSGIESIEHFDDSDGDGLFVETFSAKIATVAAKASSLDHAKFTFDANGDVLAMQELSKGRWKTEKLDLNEHLEIQTLDGVEYVVKVETDFEGVSASYYRDDNGDGVWTEVAEFESTTEIDLVGVAALLAGTDGLVG